MQGKIPLISSVHISKVRMLSDIDILVGDDGNVRHLILTGKNGSGKTSLLQSMWRHICLLAEDRGLNHLAYRQHLLFFQSRKKEASQKNDEKGVAQAEAQIARLKSEIGKFWDEVDVKLLNAELLPALVGDRSFLLAYYSDKRLSEFKAPKNPEKPDLNFKIKDNKVDQFLKFLVDLKVQRALAAEENKQSAVEEINQWFDSFTKILQRIFRDDTLSLDFNYKNYEFTIRTSAGSFPFTGLSAGYSAVLDIVADMMLKMQQKDKIVRTFEMPGIVFIDEVETHLHLELQKEILHILASIFPNVQYVVSTHSPFVVSAVKNSTIFDLEKKERVVDLTEYSYGSLMEGFFGVDSDSAELKRRVEMFASLVGKSERTADDEQEIKRLKRELSALPEWTAPALKTRFNELNLRNTLGAVR